MHRIRNVIYQYNGNDQSTSNDSVIWDGSIICNKVFSSGHVFDNNFMVCESNKACSMPDIMVTINQPLMIHSFSMDQLLSTKCFHVMGSLIITSPYDYQINACEMVQRDDDE